MSAGDWPDYIAPNAIEWWLETQTRSAGPSILGAERIIASPSARWRCNMSFRIWGTLGDPSRLLYWRGMMGRLYGRSGLMTISPFDQLTPARLAGFDSGFNDQFAPGGTSADAATFSDGSTFSDGASFTQPESAGLAVAAAARGARSLQIKFTGSGAPQFGQYFGLASAYLHLIDNVAVNADGTLTLSFSPGLRQPVAAGAALEFERPVATMRLSADDGGRARIAIGGVADVTLDMVEAF